MCAGWVDRVVFDLCFSRRLRGGYHARLHCENSSHGVLAGESFGKACSFRRDLSASAGRCAVYGILGI